MFLYCQLEDSKEFIVVPCAVWVLAAGINLVSVPQLKPLHGFTGSPNFQGMFTPRGS